MCSPVQFNVHTKWQFVTSRLNGVGELVKVLLALVWLGKLKILFCWGLKKRSNMELQGTALEWQEVAIFISLLCSAFFKLCEYCPILLSLAWGWPLKSLTRTYMYSGQPRALTTCSVLLYTSCSSNQPDLTQASLHTINSTTSWSVVDLGRGEIDLGKLSTTFFLQVTQSKIYSLSPSAPPFSKQNYNIHLQLILAQWNAFCYFCILL